MKKTILLSSILALGAVFAAGTDVTSGNAIGVLDVAVEAVPAQKLIAVPFGGYGTGGAVAVKDMVKTSNLAAGSRLYVADGKGTYNTWTLNAEGAWAADTKVNISSSAQPTAGSSDSQDDATVNRGDAFWIQPIFKDGTSGALYLLGEGETTSGQSTVEAGWNLVGNTATIARHVSNEGYLKGEKICIQRNDAVGSLESYTFKDELGWVKTGARVASTITIQPGQGFWFLSKGTKSIAW